MTGFNEDRNLLGRIGALAFLAAVGMLLSRVFCLGGSRQPNSAPSAGPGENLRDAAADSSEDQLVLPCCLGKQKKTN